MTRRLVLLTEIISTYRIPLFNALARQSVLAFDRECGGVLLTGTEMQPPVRQSTCGCC